LDSKEPLIQNAAKKHLKIKIFFELSFWINLPSGKYTFKHFNQLKAKIDPLKVQLLSLTDDFLDSTLELENFLWKIGFDHLNPLSKKYNSIYARENIQKQEIIPENVLKKWFNEDYDHVFFQKLKSVIHHEYDCEINYDSTTKKSLKELIEPLFTPLKDDFLQAVNEFIELYIGYFSTTSFNNDAFPVADPFFSSDRTNITLQIDDEDKTAEIGFPLGLYSPPFYPAFFPKKIITDKFIEYLKTDRKPSFTKILIGYSNRFFLHGDLRLGIINLDMALENCLGEFIEYYNAQNPNQKFPNLTKNHTLGDFLRLHLPNFFEKTQPSETVVLCSDSLEFHNLRNLVIHKKQRRFKSTKIEKMRRSVLNLISLLEDYMRLPKICSASAEQDFIGNPIGTALEPSEAGLILLRFFGSYSEVIRDREQKRNKK